MSFSYLRDRWRKIFSRRRAPSTPKMVGWESLPLLPLQRILQYLDLEDALAAMSVCRHWRTAAWFYEGNKHSVLLSVDNFERNMFVTRLFRKNVKHLYIYVNAENEEWERFFDVVLPEFFDAVDLRLLSFQGPSHMEHDYKLPLAKLKRVVVESLIFRHIETLRRLSIIGCEMDDFKEGDLHMHDKVKEVANMLEFNSVSSEADRILSRCNIAHMACSSITQVILDYEQASQAALATLCEMPKLYQLTLSVTETTTVKEQIKWGQLPIPIPVCITLVGVPERRMNYIIDNILINVVLLASIKVLFSGTFYHPLITHLVQHHKNTLTEFVWVDTPLASTDPSERYILSKKLQADMYMNPLILLCWQCEQLKRLAIHGYWIWAYDVLGFLRLRKDLKTIELSAVYTEHDRFECDRNQHVAVRVLDQDEPEPASPGLKKSVSEFSDCEWVDEWPWYYMLDAEHPGDDSVLRAECVLQELDGPVPYVFNI